MKKKKYWAGYCDGKIFVFQNLSGANVVEIFLSRKNAKKVYEDVRPVEIKEIKQGC